MQSCDMNTGRRCSERDSNGTYPACYNTMAVENTRLAISDLRLFPKPCLSSHGQRTPCHCSTVVVSEVKPCLTQFVAVRVDAGSHNLQAPRKDAVNTFMRSHITRFLVQSSERHLGKEWVRSVECRTRPCQRLKAAGFTVRGVITPEPNRHHSGQISLRNSSGCRFTFPEFGDAFGVENLVEEPL